MRLALAQLMVAIAAPLVLSAQNQAPRHEQAPDQGKTVTVTGCLARGVEPKTFVLKNVAWQSPRASSPRGTHDSQPPASAANAPPTSETLRLAGAASTLGLEAYVGHIISATGALANTDPPVTTGTVPEPQGDTTSRTRAAEEQAASTLRTFDMRSMTDVAPECR